ncbi:MAG: hypothetical protein K0U59_05105 [Gammaproteobacteria bacterium]|nr:hypothetical protein [Gammaproteobacteria bacterium]
MQFKRLWVTAALSLFSLVATTLMAEENAIESTIAKGQRQLIQAIDAAWVRVLRSGRYQQVLADPSYFAVPQGTPSYEIFVNQADCLPDPQTTQYPSDPVGNFKIILQQAKINRCTLSYQPLPWDTTNFSRASEALENAIFEELGDHYKVAIKRKDIEIAPPFNFTTALNNGSCDYIQQVNALGGETEGLRRRDSRLFSCVVSSSAQYAFIPSSSDDRPCVANDRCASATELVRIQRIVDLQANSRINICTGNLSTQTSNRFFAENRVNTVRFPGDIGNCAENISGEGYCVCPPSSAQSSTLCAYRPSDNIAGVCPSGVEHRYDDLMIFSIPDIDEALIGPYAVFNGQYRQFDLKIVAGTPLWVGIEPPQKQ